MSQARVPLSVFPPPRTATTPDGVELATTVTGAGTEHLLFVPPTSAPPLVFRHQARYLAARYRVVTWDARGMYGSGPATRFDVPSHTDDALFALDQAGAGVAHVVAWSTGAEIALDLVRRAKDRVASLVFLCPAFGGAYAEALGVPGSGPLRRLTVALRSALPLSSSVRSRAGLWPETGAYLRRFGIAAETLDEELFREAAHAFKKSDRAAYLATMEAIEAYADAPRPEEIAKKTLVVVGEKDRFGSVVGAKLLARRLPAGELFVVRSGTHYAPIELPELINLRIEKFLQQGEREAKSA